MGDNSSSVILNETNKRKRKMDEIKKAKKPKDSEFSKHKLGIFNKAIELSILCQSKTALIVKKPDNNKLYACGYPCDAVIHRFLTGHMVEDEKKKKEDDENCETLRLQYEALQAKHEEEKDNLKRVEKSDFNFHDWWNNSIDDMDLASVKDFKTSLENLKTNLRVGSEAKKLCYVNSDISV